MAGIFGVLGVASRGLAATQAGIGVTAHNVSNVNTPGYTRQRQVLAAGPALAGRDGAIGTGVDQVTIERVSDGLVTRQLLAEEGQAAALGVEANGLADVEAVFAEGAGVGIGAALSGFLDSLHDLASSASAGASVEREAVRAAARTLIDTVHRADRALRDVQSRADQRARTLAGEVSELSREIAALNESIVRAEVVAPANDLRDQRDQLLAELSRKVDLSSFERENGSIVVLVAGSLPLVDGASAHRLVTEPDPSNPFDPSFVRVVHEQGGRRVDVTDAIAGGELGGALRVRDTLAAGGLRALDTVAFNLVERVNATHGAGVGLDGLGGDFFAGLAAVEDAARSLALDPRIEASPDAIAAGLTAAPGDNRNALDLAAIATTPGALFLPGDPPGPASGPTRTLLDHVAVVQAEVGAQSRSTQIARDAQDRVVLELQNRRDAVSAVSLDEEMVQLIRLEAAYQANARVLSSVDQLLDDLLATL